MRRPRSLALAAVAIAALGTLTACGSQTAETIVRGTADPPPSALPAPVFGSGTCPSVTIEPDRESFRVWDKGQEGVPTALRFLASVQRVARECSRVGDNVVARVGAAGRVVSGPTAAAGTITVPVTYRVVANGQVVYTRTVPVPVSVNAPDFSANWAQVDEAVTIPTASADAARIFVSLEDPQVKPQKPKRP